MPEEGHLRHPPYLSNINMSQHPTIGEGQNIDSYVWRACGLSFLDKATPTT